MNNFDTFKEYYTVEKINHELDRDKIEEGMADKLRSAMAASALGVASLTGGYGTEPNEKPAITQNIKRIDIPNLWSKHYQGTNNPKKEARARMVVSKKYIVPKDAVNAIQIATYIFGGDMGVKKDTLGRLLKDTGAIESGYKTKVQYGDGPARGYWQVEPSTAIDLLKNSRSLFGSKFQKYFKLELLTKMNNKQMAGALEKNDALAASFAAAKWITAAHKDLKESIYTSPARDKSIRQGKDIADYAGRGVGAVPFGNRGTQKIHIKFPKRKK